MTAVSFLEPSLEKQLKGHRNSITAAFFSPNEQQLATSSLDNCVLLWDLCGSMRSFRFKGHDEAVTDVSFSPSGKYMASASRDKTVRIWVPTVTGSTGVFTAHSQTVRTVQFTPDGLKIITASDDKIVKLWSSQKHKFIASFVGHTNWVRCARISNDGSIIASCSDDKTTKLWNPENRECIHTFKNQKGYGLNLAWHPTGCYIAIGTSDGSVKLYDIRTHNLVQYYNIHDDAVTQVSFHPSGSYILTASKDGKMKILDLLEGNPVFTLSRHNGAVNAVNFSPTGDIFASAGDDKLVCVWKTNFTEMSNDTIKNLQLNQPTVSKSTLQTSKLTSTIKEKHQGVRPWYKCYHSTAYPITTFDNIEDVHLTSAEGSFNSLPVCEEPNANSTEINEEMISVHQQTTVPSTFENNTRSSANMDNSVHFQNISADFSVGHASHIPRSPPKPTTYSIPRSFETQVNEKEIFGMIKLKENDVCYTNGTIEWVSRKRCFPLNSGFKTMNQSLQQLSEPLNKIQKFNKTFNVVDNIKYCDCADVLPTVNAIVGHLNALHEAVDLVDLRLNTLEDVLSKNKL